MIVYGKNVAVEILKNKEIVKAIYLSNNFNDEEIKRIINNNNYKINYLDKEQIDRKVNANTQGILIEINEYEFIDFKTIENDNNANFIVILDHIEDPHNIGAIIRTCECASVDYIIIPNKRTVSINATVMKTSSGALINSKLCEVANLRNTIEKLKKLGYWIIGTDMNGEDYTKIDYKGKVALVIGNEGSGLTHIVKEACDFIASIPMKGKINSLNASVACGIMVYEILKSRE